MLRRTIHGLPWRELVASVVRILTATAAMGLVLWSFLYFVGNVSPWLSAIGGMVLGGATFLLAAVVLRAPEPASVLRLARRRKAT